MTTPRTIAWLPRALAVVLVPVVFLAIAEAALRLAGTGYAPDFFLPVEGANAEYTNPRFGYRFFPQQLAREPVMQILPEDGVVDEFRIFVLGGSAAMGYPDPAFSVGAILEVLLEEIHPEIDFRVFNAAFVAINSHVVREIAAECARRRPDAFVVYVGNNEVVGPYGPGSVLGGAPPNLELLRLGLALRRYRLGQAFSAGTRRLRSTGAAPDQWRGMEMFVEKEVAANDPRLERVYASFERNLEDIVRHGREAGAAVVLSTVAVNLDDSPPFGSRRQALSGQAEERRWQELSMRALEARDRGDWESAAAALSEALRIDDGHARTEYLQGKALTAQGRPDEARAHYRRARDLDTLRFRADGRINDVIRSVAGTAGNGVTLFDAARDFQEPSADGSVPQGADLFYEHVHFRFAGSYRLAAGLQRTISELLVASGRAAESVAWEPPSPSEVSDRLALTNWDLWRLEKQVAKLTSRPPFDEWVDFSQRRRRTNERIRQLRRVTPEERATALAVYRRAVAGSPDNLSLRVRYAKLLVQSGKSQRGIEEWRRVLARAPEARKWRSSLAHALAASGRLEEAHGEYLVVSQRYPEFAQSFSDLARITEKLGRAAEAERLYRRGAELQPTGSAAALALSNFLSRADRVGEAEATLRAFLTIRPESSDAWRRLAALVGEAGRIEESEAAYREALSLAPDWAGLRADFAKVLARRGLRTEALAAYREALSEDPDIARAWFGLGDLLLDLDRPEEAVAAYRAGLDLQSKNERARRNLETALERSRAAGEGL